MEDINSLPTISQGIFDIESKNNNVKAASLLGTIFPELSTPLDCVFEILAFLGETQVNPRILPKVIRGVNNILIGTGKGQVIVHVSKETMNVSVRESDSEIKCKVKS